MWKCPPATILVPVDFGGASARAAEIAGALSARVDGSVRLLHAEALEAPAYFTHDQIASLERQRQAARAQAETYLATFARRHGVPAATVLLRDGPPVPTILTAAAENDLVIMGTHGRLGPRRWWLGSVAEGVVRESPAPVLVVREAPAAPPESAFLRPLVVAPRGTYAEQARRVADGLASAFGGQVVDEVAVCEGDLARHREATAIVVARHEATERWLRGCTLPMLFVP